MAVYYTVVRGDNLTKIAKRYGTTWRAIYDLNRSKIKNPNLIYAGQVLLISNSGGSGGSGSGSGSGSTASKPAPAPSTATITSFGPQAGTENTIFAVWTWSSSNTEHYETIWDYYVEGNNLWFRGSTSTTDIKESLYNPPSNASQVRFQVKPISKTYESNGKTASYWTAGWSTAKVYNLKDNAPTKPESAPNVELKNFTLTATLDNVDVNGDQIQFQIVKDNVSVFNTGTADITTSHVSYSCTVEVGSEYKVRCRAVRNNLYSEWTDYSPNYGTKPSAPTGFTVCRANSTTSVYLEWSAVNTAESYEIEYTTEARYFEGSDSLSSVTGIETTSYEKTGLQMGDEYFFRIRAVNQNGNSVWSEVSSVAIGKPPSAPTTWSSTTTAITGEALNLYWIHNAADGSSQTYAEVEIIADGVKDTYTIQNSTDEDEKDKTSVYFIDTSDYEEGTSLQWRVRTAGVTLTYGDWSIQRTVDIYAPPVLQMNITDISHTDIDTINSFPFYIRGLPGPNTQAPIGYYLEITTKESYLTVDEIGREKYVNAGDKVYSQYFDISQALVAEISAHNVDLENNVGYKVSCTVSMNSGLTATASSEFTVAWDEEAYDPNAEMSIDKETAVAYIKPYCRAEIIEAINEYRDSVEFFQNIVRMVWEDDSYINDAARIADLEATGGYNYDIIEPLVLATLSGEVLDVRELTIEQLTDLGFTPEQIEDITTPISDEPVYELIENLTLSVYRKEFDGTFTEIASNLPNDYTVITDPHPALDYARYRIIATSTETGAVSYRDLPGYPVGETSIIIQWAEDWTNYNVTETSVLEQPPWSGSLLRLPYNIDVSNDNTIDSSLIEYIGRSHPTSYYGTQLGETATWNTEFDKDDKETLYTLRRLSIWRGDVYVREPSGSGYWASVSVSYNQNHTELTIPVTINVTRVEGGM